MEIKFGDAKYYAYTGTHDPASDLESVVFVHGAAMDHTVWAHQSRYFAYHGYNVFAVDLPAHQFSRGELLLSIERMAAWLNQVIDQTVGTAFHIVGHSMGALIALEAAANFNHPDAGLNSLSLIGFSYPMSVTPQLMDAAQHNPSEAYSMMTQWSHASAIGGEPVPGFWSAGMQLSMMENSTAGSVHTDLIACDNYAGGEAAFVKVTCPILFLSGMRDKMAPAKLAQAEADKNNNAAIVLLPDCGHSIMSESPDGVLNELKRFIGARK
ncbi:alpha/beta fold hydrolase [Candidatus Spongiihabitans sp.]|uniref:alpha/beta fold hydrolase n=1 Tax=Candidatus Spongiihabitans sp. TaxID=3101308 RepID=UPI003C7D5AF2